MTDEKIKEIQNLCNELQQRVIELEKGLEDWLGHHPDYFYIERIINALMQLSDADKNYIARQAEARARQVANDRYYQGIDVWQKLRHRLKRK